MEEDEIYYIPAAHLPPHLGVSLNGQPEFLLMMVGVLKQQRHSIASSYSQRGLDDHYRSLIIMIN